jgi:ABC-type uncharacterized transport system ATPase subunit
MVDTAAPAVCMVGIHKHFGAVAANVDVRLNVVAGTVHGIVGENGAGKSTLMSILYGFYQADRGQIEVFGKPATIRNADDAIALGIGMVHQHFMLVDTLSALENVMLGAEPHWLLQKADTKVRARLTELMQSTGLQIPLDALVADLPVGDRQRLEILKALYRGARILILDEPTAVLTPQETTQLFGVLRRLREQGTTLILITHKLKEVMALCDVVTVMRAGQVVQDVAIQSATIEGLAQAMVGRRVNVGRTAEDTAVAGEVLLQASQLSVVDGMGVHRLKEVGLTLRAGEIVGVAGVSGNGQSELMDVLTGLLAPGQGEMTVLGQHFSSGQWLDPSRARSLGLAHVPEDRHARALVMAFAAWESAALGYDNLPSYATHGWSYTLYYATTFVFTGLAVAVAFHGGLFNIGGEGQAMMGGLGCALVALGGRRAAAGPAAAADGAGGHGFRPGLGRGAGALQAWRGSHIVITTIMFNFIASGAAGLPAGERAEGAGQHGAGNRAFAESAAAARHARAAGRAGHRLAAHAAEPERAAGRGWPRWGVPAAVAQSRRAMRCARWASPDAAHYAGIRPGSRSAGDGDLGRAGRAGGHQRDRRRAAQPLLLEFVVGAGFTGIAVA